MVTPDPNPTCDIFCRVIDNYGDIGVCWRLARQLHDEHGWHVRLWVDEPAAGAKLTQGEAVAGVELKPWPFDFPKVAPASVVIEAFACELPESYLAAMAAMTEKPIWLNLEYLCVEDWGPGFHLQPSPHPRLPLLKHFFVPGILLGTGGLLREAELLPARDRFDVEAARRAYAADTAGLWVFLFCYDNPALPLLLETWAGGEQTVHCLVAAGKAEAQVSAWLGEKLVPGQSVSRSALHLHPLPFVSQGDFDALLWACDVNFVRGEDSFSRALWAARPFVWHIYPQQDAAHHAKLDAFHAHYEAPPALETFSDLWNGVTAPTSEKIKRAWPALDAALPALAAHAGTRQPQFEALGELAGNLADFCRKIANHS